MASEPVTEPAHNEQGPTNDFQPPFTQQEAAELPQSVPPQATREMSSRIPASSIHVMTTFGDPPRHRQLQRTQKDAKVDSHGHPLLLVSPPTFHETPEDSPVASSGASADEDEMWNLLKFYREGHRPLELRRLVLKWHTYNVSGDSEIFPKFIECELSVTFNGRPLPYLVRPQHHGAEENRFPNPYPNFVWYEESSYQSIQKYCEDQRLSIGEQLLGRVPGGQINVYLRYGLCNVIGTNDETSFSPETSKFDSDNMSEIAIKEVCRFISTYPNQKFKLVLACDYGSILTEMPHVKFLDLMKSQYLSMLNIATKTVSGHAYLSKPDRDQLTTPEITSRIIDESDDLGSIEEKENLKDIVSKEGAQTLLALCVHKGMNLRTFKHFVIHHEYKDGNMPKEAPERCEWPEYHFLCERYHPSLIEGAHQFFVQTVEEDRWFHEREKNEVVPISFACDEQGRIKDRLGQGAFSKVWEARIDVTHQSLASNLNKTYALKIFEDDNTNEASGNIAFSKEIRMLLYLAQYPHHHILTHITSWEQNRKFYILYEKAKSNLRHYTETEKGGVLTKARLLWFFSQLVGLANAVRKVHQLREPITGEISAYLTPPRASSPQQSQYSSSPEQEKKKQNKKRRRTGIVGYHHDIKPDNILAFEERSGQLPILKLSDFGAGKFSPIRQKHDSARQTHNPHGTLTYFGPEYPAGAKMTRPFDMWALGCVFLEFLLWFLDLKQAHNGPTLSTLRQRSFANSSEVFDYFWQKKTPEEMKALNKGKSAVLTKTSRHGAAGGDSHLSVPRREDLKIEEYRLNTAVENVLDELKRIHCVDMVAFQNLIQQIRGLLEVRPTKRLNAVNLANRLDAILSQLEVDLQNFEMDNEDNIYAYYYQYNQRNAEQRRNHEPLEPRHAVPGLLTKLAPQFARPQNPTDDVSAGYGRRSSIPDITMPDVSQNHDDSFQDYMLGSQFQGRLSPSNTSQSHFLIASTDEEDVAEDKGSSSRRRQRSPSAEYKAAFRMAKKSKSSQASSPGRADDEL